MAKFNVSVRPYKCSARPKAKWVLNVWHPTGKRERSYFETKEAAEAAAQVKTVEVQNLGWRALQIDDRLRLEALDAMEKLAPYGVSITAVIAEYIRRRGSSSIPSLKSAPSTRSKVRWLEAMVDGSPKRDPQKLSTATLIVHGPGGVRLELNDQKQVKLAAQLLRELDGRRGC